MKLNLNIITLFVCCMAFPTTVFSYTDPEETAMAKADSIESQLLREGEVTIENAKAGDYAGINLNANRISLNNDDWSRLLELFANTGEETFTIVHIGDSHLQADIATGVVRKALQSAAGNAGRGLIIPFKLASTNEPVDYRFTLSCKPEWARLLKQPWSTPMAFTGIGIRPLQKHFTLTIEQLGELQQPFRFMRIYVTGSVDIAQIHANNTWIPFTCDKQLDDGYCDIFLDAEVPDVELVLDAPQLTTIHGVSLGTETPGVFYHTIGNNGATYATYNNVQSFGQQISTLYPDLIIVSLGTNEAFGKLDAEEMYRQIDVLVNDLKLNNPEAKLLLTTPKESQRRRKGKHKSASYTVVDNCASVADIIRSYARENHIPLYDWWEVAGGKGASQHWVTNNLLSRDRVHNTVQGYELCGKLFSQALLDLLTRQGNK